MNKFSLKIIDGKCSFWERILREILAREFQNIFLILKNLGSCVPESDQMGNIKRETNMERKMFRAWTSYIKYRERKGTICRYTAHLLLHILNRKNRWTNIKNNNICRYWEYFLFYWQFLFSFSASQEYIFIIKI